MAGLYRSDKNDQPVPAVATSYHKSSDGKTYTFNLRHNAKWSNGDTVTAPDFVTAWRKGVSPKAMSGYNYIFSNIKNADQISQGKKPVNSLGVKAVGKYKLVVQLENPEPTFIDKMVMPAFYPQNTRLVKKYGAKYGTAAKYTAFDGAFKVTKWTNTSEKWTAVKNQHYYAKSAVKLQKLNYQVVKDSNTAHQLFQQGSLDDAVVSGTTAQGLQNNKNLYHLYRSGNNFVNLNMARGAVLANKQLRQALYLAVNRTQLSKKVLADGSKPSYTFSAPNAAKDPASGKDFATAAQPKETYNVAKAKKLWQAGLKQLGKSKVELTLVASDTTTNKNVSEFLQSQLESKLPGLKVTVKNLPSKSAYNLVANGKYDLYLSLWLNDYADPYSELQTLEKTNSYNYGKYTSAAYNNELSQARKNAATRSVYFSHLLKAQEQMNQDYPVLPLYTMVEDHLVNSNLKGVLWHKVGMVDYTRAYFK
jgi:oligopeptide transport system substrate-binding protein